MYDYSAGGYGNVTVRVVDAASPCPQVEIVGKIEVSDSDKATLAISGGKYTTELKADWCAEGFLPVRNTDGTYGVAAIPTVPTTYRVSVTAGEGGSVSASRRSAARGTTVTVTVTPDEGYELSEITAVTAAPSSTPMSVLLVSLSRMLSSLPPDARLSPSPMICMPYRNSARPQSISRIPKISIQIPFPYL